MATSYQGGDDVVFNFQPLMQTIANNAQYEQNRIKEQRKQRDQIQQQATKDLSKINANGLWNADLPQFNEMYNGLKETYYQLSKVSDNDPDKARELSMELASRMSQVDAFVAQSQDFSSNYSKSLDGVKNLVGKGRAQEYKDHLLSLSNKPSTELGRDMLDSSPYIYTYDPNKVATRVQRVAKDMLSSVTPQTSTVGSYTTSGGKRYDTIQQSKEVGTTQSFESLSNLAKRDREVGAYVQDLMDNEGLDFNGAINYMQEEFADNFREVSTTDRSADKSKTTFKISLGDDNDEIQKTITPDYEIARRDNGTSVSLKNFMPLDQPQNIGGVLRAHDPLNNQQEVLQGAHNARVLGVGTNSRGNELLLISVPSPRQGRPDRLLTVNKNQYLNRISLSKREADYINMWENQKDDNFPALGGQSQTSTTNSNTSQQTQTTNRPKFN